MSASRTPRQKGTPKLKRSKEKDERDSDFVDAATDDGSESDFETSLPTTTKTARTTKTKTKIAPQTKTKTEPKTAASKSSSKKPTGARPRKRVKISVADPLLAATVAAKISLQKLEFENPNIDLNDDVTVYGQFLKAIKDFGLQSHPGKPHVYTPVYNSTSTHILDMPLYDEANRFYVLLESEVSLYDHALTDGSSSKCWRLQAQNIRDPGSEPIDLFVQPSIVSPLGSCPTCITRNNTGVQSEVMCSRQNPCYHCVKQNLGPQCTAMLALERQQGPNIITELFCKDRNLVIQLGKIKVDAMNRMPETLPAPQRSIVASSAHFIMHSIWIFIDIASLVRWKQLHNPTVHLGELNLRRNGRVVSMWSAQHYGAPMPWKRNQNQVKSNMIKVMWTPTIYPYSGPTHTSNPSKTIPLLISAVQKMDAQKVAACTDLRTYAMFGTPDDTITTDLGKEAVRIGQEIAYQLVGHIGSHPALRAVIDNKKKSFQASGDMHAYRGPKKGNGPYNGVRIWGFPYKNVWGVIQIRPTLKVMEGLSDEVNHTWALRTLIDDKVCLAYIMQSSLVALAQGHDLVNVVFSAFLAAEYIETGVLTRDDILDSYCACEDEAMRATTDHHCMWCFAIATCSQTARKIVDGSVLVVCQQCIGQSDTVQIFRPHDFLVRIASNCRSHLEKEKKYGMVHTWTSTELVKAMQDKFITPGNSDEWKDGYSGVMIPFKAQTHDPTSKLYRFGARKHPHGISIEKPHPLWVDDDGNKSMHGPENCIFTKDCINRLKGTFGPSILPLLKKSLQLKKRFDADPACRRYMPDVVEEWNVIERAYDNQRMISMLNDLSIRARIESKMPDDRLRQVIAMERSGMWDGNLLPSPDRLRRAFIMRGDRFASFPATFRQSYPMWTKEECEIILGCISQIQNDRSTDGMNRHNLVLPRLGKNKIPWPWREDGCPEDADMGLLFREFAGRLHTMATLCNRKHTTNESPATLFIETIVQWFEKGGKCHIFGFVMTPFIGHPTNYSFGRGRVQHMPDGKLRYIQAGEPMKTGCKTLLPKDMVTDYDISRRTISVESWRANTLEFCYENSEVLMDLLEKAVLDLQDECAWYGPVGGKDDYQYVPMPKTKSKVKWAAAMMQNSVGVELTAPDTSEHELDEEEDEEVVTLSENHALVRAVQETGDIKPQDEASMSTTSTPGEGVEGMFANDVNIISEMNVDPEIKKQFTDMLNRYKTAMHKSTDSGISSSRQIAEDAHVTSSSREDQVETSRRQGMLEGKYEVYSDIYSRDPEGLGEKVAHCLENMKIAAEDGDVGGFKKAEEMFKYQLPLMFP
ncbi:hypothetical protein HBH56_106820 [Parastagonospora nodorum]|uniref:Uncharacterized protein n=2 Tax=Phaeosphaeria nodorum (strain SN15 / ATCC MYA-4574 / FGSC 10173) TaxID=321614 RepID=Q0UBT7_PHANO|nr:hypothetical protein SNOG_10777 [Parastagonospora nodorum SN15]KAH3913719.1 hypothetical protein HBH56_106820 [Parastagonospora nodorum]EAT82171.2 hypothetical protein SNOG_10777 [Parastagonospora nodorum SN15]KAH3929199.1 hypothetical protein HBH54_123600 [Parastagonospora nodorum]KAH4137607.1 hypothetical protein HBH45_122250 [Parastagonospora nodorum]KAH4146495.1 hypothetical protein HBH44_241510 [Parastagonospora nodorum]